MIIRDNFPLFSIKTCDPSPESSQQDGSDEGSQHTLYSSDEK